MLKYTLFTDETEDEELDLIPEANPEQITVDVDSGKIYVFQEITDSVALDIMRAIEILTKIDEIEEINLIINSNGGHATSAIAICESLLASKKPIKTTGVGKIFSAAVPILACGNKGKREISKRTFAMIHQPSVTPSALTTNQTKVLNKAMTILTDFFQDLCGIHSTDEQKKRITKIIQTGEDIYVTSKELVELGIADIII